ncbi:MAG TPA: phage replisome organizer N-terminal domain-containing protein, partial [Treponemataceae bacterium]|nr:phage replisome organizer N-terminal domain-containing protein [Treponemataceae bacterium]
MEDGYLYSNILLKLYLKSLKGVGKLSYNDRIPYTPEMLAKILRHSVGVVEKAIDIFVKLELIEILDSGAIFVSDIQNFVGRSSTEADRIREYRTRIDQEKRQLKGDCTNVQEVPYKCTTEIEIEKEIEKEIDKDKTSVFDKRFEEFWKAYPKKVGKGYCRDIWKKLKPSQKLTDEIVAAIKQQKKSEQWEKDKGQFIPNPATWLNQERWEDELPKATNAGFENNTYDADDFFQAALNRKD